MSRILDILNLESLVVVAITHAGVLYKLYTKRWKGPFPASSNDYVYIIIEVVSISINKGTQHCPHNYVSHVLFLRGWDFFVLSISTM